MYSLPSWANLQQRVKHVYRKTESFANPTDPRWIDVCSRVPGMQIVGIKILFVTVRKPHQMAEPSGHTHLWGTRTI